ncbi:hypothetical protein R1sor_010645 [Riccia sorocarpa]|uniref:Uncharacterized protein n=1 Tax=Riccia sorocarpa TaxID=122646 RepID=A0ABD3I221_9MARC
MVDRMKDERDCLTRAEVGPNQRVRTDAEKEQPRGSESRWMDGNGQMAGSATVPSEPQADKDHPSAARSGTLSTLQYSSNQVEEGVCWRCMALVADEAT